MYTDVHVGIAKLNTKHAPHAVRSPVLSNSLLFPNPPSTGYSLPESQPRDGREVSSFSQLQDVSSFSLLSTTNTSTSWSPSSENLTFDNPNFVSTPTSQQLNLETSSKSDISGGAILGSAVTVRRLRPRTTEKHSTLEKESLVIRPRSLRVAKLLDISPPPPTPPPFIVAARPDQQSSTVTEPTVPNSKVCSCSHRAFIKVF